MAHPRPARPERHPPGHVRARPYCRPPDAAGCRRPAQHRQRRLPVRDPGPRAPHLARLPGRRSDHPRARPCGPGSSPARPRRRSVQHSLERQPRPRTRLPGRSRTPDRTRRTSYRGRRRPGDGRADERHVLPAGASARSRHRLHRRPRDALRRPRDGGLDRRPGPPDPSRRRCVGPHHLRAVSPWPAAVGTPASTGASGGSARRRRDRRAVVRGRRTPRASSSSAIRRAGSSPRTAARAAPPTCR